MNEASKQASMNELVEDLRKKMEEVRKKENVKEV